MANYRLLFFSGLAAAAVMTLAAFAAAPSFDFLTAFPYALGIMATEVARLDIGAVLLLTAIISIIAVARPSPAAFRDFWLCITSRVSYPVASTT